MKPVRFLEVARKSAIFKSLGNAKIKNILQHFRERKLEKGDFLFHANDASKMMSFIIEGKLRVEKVSSDNQVTKIATLVSGDIVGEVAILTGERHSGQVRAMTDVTLISIGKRDLDALFRRYPRFLQNLTRIEAMRLRRNNMRQEPAIRELGFLLHIYVTTPGDYRAAEMHTSAALAAQKLKYFYMFDHNFLDKTAGGVDGLRQRLSRTLLQYPTAYLSVDAANIEPRMLAALIRMADRLVFTVSSDEESVLVASSLLTNPQTKPRAINLKPILFTVHHATKNNMLQSEIEKIFQLPIRCRIRLGKNYWEEDEHRDVEIQCTTAARIICGTTRGIAFGGGGARTLSEIGIISELERHKVDFDHVAGTSMGALIAAFYASGLTAREMNDRFKYFLPNDKGLLRYNLPFISFFRDRSINGILKRLFGRTRIEDLPKPLTIVAADLISGQEIRLQKGLLWRALRASMSLPVIFAPVKYHKYYLVDGGTINNVPGDVLREQGVERVLGINCTPLEDDAIAEYLESTNLFQLLRPGNKFWRNFKRFWKLLRIFFTRPPILQIANRAMMLEGSELIRKKSHEFDLLLSPDVARYGLFEFDRREEIIDSGRHYARTHSADLKRIFRA
jgi:NTE family protein